MSSLKNQAVEAETVHEIKDITPSIDGQHVLITAVIERNERVFALAQAGAMTASLNLMSSAIECERILASDDAVSVLLPGQDIGVALSERGSLILHIVTANDITMAFQFDMSILSALQSQLAIAESLVHPGRGHIN